MTSGKSRATITISPPDGGIVKNLQILPFRFIGCCTNLFTSVQHMNPDTFYIKKAYTPVSPGPWLCTLGCHATICVKNIRQSRRLLKSYRNKFIPCQIRDRVNAAVLGALLACCARSTPIKAVGLDHIFSWNIDMLVLLFIRNMNLISLQWFRLISIT